MERIKITFTYDVDTETGEMTLVSKELENGKKRSTSSKKTTVVDNDPTPRLILEENKYTLNTAAVTALGVEPDAKIDIKYEKNGKSYIPVIGSDEVFGTKGGNRLTKSFTVSCRGKNHDELSQFGTQFELAPHESKPGLFILIGDKDVIVDNTIDDNIAVEDEDLSDLEDLMDDSDNDTTISAINFDLNNYGI